jgi:hypothetical protein
MVESINRRITVQGVLDKKARSYVKITRVKRAGGMVQVVVYLPSKHEALSSNPCTTKKRKKREQKTSLVSLKP